MKKREKEEEESSQRLIAQLLHNHASPASGDCVSVGLTEFTFKSFNFNAFIYLR